MSKIVLITGAKGGLGTSVTQAFLDAGATVVGSSRSIADSDFSHPNFSAISSELTSGESAKALIDRILTKHGRVDAAVHLVGGFGGGKSLIDTSAQEMEQMLQANLWSAFYLFQAVLPQMRKQQAGALIAIGSRTAVEPQTMLGAYSLSKAALLSLMATLARENKDRGISANVILPGTMDTAANRKAMPDADATRWVATRDIAGLIVKLALKEIEGINGAAIPMYGGEL